MRSERDVRDEVVGLGELPLRIICGWCGIVLRDGRGVETHGICAVCESTAEVAVPFTDPVTRRRFGLVPVDSSNLVRAGWYADGASGVAIIEFTGGARYRYLNAPRGWWLSFWAAESKGKFLSATLKADPTRFPCARIAEQV